MREIKFKAWDKKGKQIINHEHLIMTCDGFFAIDEEGTEFPMDVIMQYTGRKDKNSKEIYRGHIVSFGLLCNPLGSSYELQTGEVIFEYGSFVIKYYFDWSEKIEFRNLSDFFYSKESHYVPNVGDVFDRSDKPINDLEIIGNKFENPELRIDK